MTTENATDTHDGAPRRSKRFGLVALVLAAIAGAVIAALAVTLLGRPSAPSTPTSAAPVATATTAAEVKERWQCPMHPSVVMDHPGKCPICGMELVKMEGGAGASDAGEAPGTGELATVTIDPARQQLIGLRTEEATHGPVGGRWRTNGRVAIDETRVRHVNLKVGGFVERVFVDFVGKTVSKGQPLFAMYSPELYAAQAEYLLALETKKRLAEGGALAGNGDELLRSARKKLELWDVSKADIDRLEATGEASRTLTLYAPISGVVVKKDVVEGMRLEAGAMPYEIVDLSVVWVLADVYERELANVKVGMPATLALKALPNRAFEGQVLFMDPLLDPATRTVKVRLAFPNRTGELRPEMFGEVTLQSSPRHALRIPADAVVDSGTRSIVFVALGAGKFAPREVELGADDGTFVEVARGLREGEHVVTRANFLVDSESRLRASLASMTAAPAGHDHGGRAQGSATPSAPDEGPAPKAATGHEGHGR